MNPHQWERYRAIFSWSGWIAFFSPVAFVLAFILSVFRDHYGAVMAVIGTGALYGMLGIIVIGFFAGVISTIGAAIYSEKQMRVQGLVGIFGAFSLILFAFLAGITNAILMGLGAFAQ